MPAHVCKHSGKTQPIWGQSVRMYVCTPYVTISLPLVNTLKNNFKIKVCLQTGVSLPVRFEGVQFDESNLLLIIQSAPGEEHSIDNHNVSQHS